MKNTFVKICGITNIEDAKAALAFGADALGFNFYQKSPRYIKPIDAKVIIRQLPAKAKFVGVFVNSSREEVSEISKSAPLDAVQFHGDESEEILDNWDIEVIRALRIDGNLDIESIKRLEEKVDHLLFDSLSKEYGGSGIRISQKDLISLKESSLLKNAIIAGGLNCSNVREIIEKYQPFGVDVASGVEREAGKKDHRLLKDFIKLAKNL